MTLYDDIFEAIAYAEGGPALSRKTTRRLLDVIAKQHKELEVKVCNGTNV